MNGVRRRDVSSHGHKKLLLILLLILCAAVGLALYLLTRPRTYPDLPRAEDPTTSFSSRDVNEIARLTVQNGAGSRYTIVQAENSWRMEGVEDFVFSDTMLSDALSNAAVVLTSRTVLDLKDNPSLTASDFGVTENGIRVDVSYTDGESLTFYIGSAVPEETPAYYFMVENDTRVFAISQDVHDTYSRAQMTLHSVTDPALSGELIDRITVTGDKPFTIERRMNGWYMTAPFRYPLSSAAVDSFLGKLEELRFATYETKAEKADLALYGLDTPRRTVTLDIADSIVTGYDENSQVIAEKSLDAYQLTFACGNDVNDVTFYCLYRGDIVRATHFSSGILLMQTHDTLISPAPFDFPTNMLSRLVWQQEKTITAYDITLTERLLENNAFETDASGNILYDVVVSRDGQAVDSNAFLLFYQQLASLETLSPLPKNYTPAQEARLTVTLQYEDYTRTVAFYPYDALHDAVQVDGTFLFYVSNTWDDAIALP